MFTGCISIHKWSRASHMVSLTIIIVVAVKDMTHSLVTSATNETPCVSGGPVVDCSTSVWCVGRSGVQKWQLSDTRSMALSMSRVKQYQCTTIFSWWLDGWSSYTFAVVPPIYCEHTVVDDPSNVVVQLDPCLPLLEMRLLYHCNLWCLDRHIHLRRCGILHIE